MKEKSVFMSKILDLYIKYKEFILYVLFGILTTVISISSYYICSEILNIHYLVSNIISWILSVIFAYFTNRVWVFESKIKNISYIFKEMFAFISCRLLSGVIDMATMFILVEAINMNDIYAKIFTQFIVVILNYVLSKLIVFRKSTN